jgi:hypothetical protein
VSGLREPTELRRELRTRIQEAYALLARERGEVHVPEDTFDMQRRLGAERDRFAAYGAAFTDAVKLLKQLMEEELAEAVGEQEGVPNQGLTIPDAEGDIRLSLDTSNVYEIDVDQIVGVFGAEYLRNLPENYPDGQADLDQLVTGLVFATFELVTSLGKFEPQVSKVKRYAATLARSGRDRESSVVTGAISETHPYKGVRFERKSP